jgi:hypothetical protein
VRSKKTIRTMTPLARKLAHLGRAMQSDVRRLAALTEALYELERSERAAQAQIIGHGLVCPLATERAPVEPLFPELPNGEGVVILTESEILQGREPPPGCDPVDPGEGAGYHPGSSEDPRD